MTVYLTGVGGSEDYIVYRSGDEIWPVWKASAWISMHFPNEAKTQRVWHV